MWKRALGRYAPHEAACPGLVVDAPLPVFCPGVFQMVGRCCGALRAPVRRVPRSGVFPGRGRTAPFTFALGLSAFGVGNVPGGAARPAAPLDLDFSSNHLFRFLHRVVSNFAFAAPENPGGSSGASFGLPREPKWGAGGPIRAPGNLLWQPGGPHWAPRAPKGCPGGSYGSLPDDSRTPRMKLSSRREHRFH